MVARQRLGTIQKPSQAIENALIEILQCSFAGRFEPLNASSDAPNASDRVGEPTTRRKSSFSLYDWDAHHTVASDRIEDILKERLESEVQRYRDKIRDADDPGEPEKDGEQTDGVVVSLYGRNGFGSLRVKAIHPDNTWS